jgi:hypothetical protein
MPNALLQEMQDAARRKDSAALETILAGLPGEPALDAFEQLVAAIELKEAGFRDLSIRVFQDLLRRDWTYAPGHYEMGVAYRWNRQRREALLAVKHAVHFAPEEFRFRALYAHLLYAEGAYPEGEIEVSRLRPGDAEETEHVEVLRDFGLYLREQPQGRALLQVQYVRDAYYWMSTEEVAAQINKAMDEKRGFSLIRMGDGEGAFTKVDAADEARYARLYGWMRRDWEKALFGQAFDARGTGYASLVDTLLDVSLEQDIVGVPYASWVDHEYSSSSLRGVPCVLNVHRAYLAAAERGQRRPAVCDQRIHIELHNKGFVEPILRRAGSVGVISCHSQLPARMKQAFGLDEVELFKIPGEKYTEGLRDQEQMSGEHFPFVFWDIVRRLSVPHDGRVFMIAAGTLAKFYADVIRKNGGIALDLGSLVDGWLNISSRPGYDSSMKLG